MSRKPRHPIQAVKNPSATAIGKRLARVQSQLNRQRIEPLLNRLVDVQRSLHNVVDHAGKEGLISPEERESWALELFRQVGVPNRTLDGLYQEIVFRENSEIVEMHEAGSLSDEAFSQRPHRAMPPKERGQRLVRAVINCRATLTNFAPVDPLGKFVKTLGQRCFGDIIDELSRLGVLRICDYCGMPMFPTRAEKRYCSRDYEGSDCSAKQRSRRSYHRKHKSPREKKRPQGGNSD